MTTDTLQQAWDAWIARHGMGEMPQLPLLPKLMVRLSATDECALYDWLHQHAIAAVEAYKATVNTPTWDEIGAAYHAGWMPQLPEPEEYDSPGMIAGGQMPAYALASFSQQQVYAFALAAVKAYRKSLKPYAYAWEDVTRSGREFIGVTNDIDHVPQYVTEKGMIPLYRLDDQP